MLILSFSKDNKIVDFLLSVWEITNFLVIDVKYVLKFLYASSLIPNFVTLDVTFSYYVDIFC